MGELEDVMAAARLWAADAHPYLATVLFAMSITATPGLKTMATDRHWRLYVDPDLVNLWSVEQFGAVMIHEAYHLIRDHADRSIAAGRSEGQDAYRFNVAADLEINDDLRVLPLPYGCLQPDQFNLPDGLLAEDYFVQLGNALPQVDCGSGAHGGSRWWEAESGPDRADVVEPLEADLIRQQVAQSIRSAEAAGGPVPSGLERWAKAFLEPKVDWRRELAAQVRAAADTVSGAVDYSYRRPSRRAGTAIGQSVVFPAMVQHIPRVAVLVDTSASMSEKHLARALAEIRGLLRAIGLRNKRLVILSCDSAVKATQQIFSVEQVLLVGGGGTDMGEGLRSASTLHPRPELVVVLTDGFTPWPEPRPPFLTIVALIGSGPAPPSWARMVRVEFEADKER
jgi:predicted metal-dependent peptidase